MALTTAYIVVPFLAGAGHVLHPGVPRHLDSRSSAIAMADGLAPFYAGVIVLRDRHDPVAGFFPEPLLICAIGDVPGDLLQQVAPAGERIMLSGDVPPPMIGPQDLAIRSTASP